MGASKRIRGSGEALSMKKDWAVLIGLFVSVQIVTVAWVWIKMGLHPLIALPIGGTALILIWTVGDDERPTATLRSNCEACLYCYRDPYYDRGAICNAFHVPGPEVSDCPDFKSKYKG